MVTVLGMSYLSEYSTMTRSLQVMVLVITWYLLSDPDVDFHDLGSGYYDSRINPERRKPNHTRQLEALGYKVTLEPAA